MAELVQSLFGVDPSMYQQAQQARQEDLAMQFASLNPMQQAQFGAFRGGQQLGNVGANLLGVQDPMLQKATMAQKLAGQFDLTTSKGLTAYASALAQNGAPDLAQMAIGRAQEMDVKAATIHQKMAEKIKQVGLTREGYQVYQSGDEQYILGPGGQRIAYYGPFESRQQKTTVDLSGLASLFAKKEAEAGAKDVTEQISKAQEQLKTGSKLSRDINELEKIIPSTYTGQLSDIAKTSSKTLSALGVPVSDKASNTEVANAIFNNFVLPAVKQLPGSLAAKELDFLKQSKPNALQEPATINRLIKMVKEDIAANRLLVQRADTYKRESKLDSLNGFNIALESDKIYQDLIRYNNLKSAAKSKQPISPEDAAFAKKFEKEIGF